MLRRVRVGGVVISVWYLLTWTIALNVTALSCLTMFVLPVEAMLAGKSLRLKARKGGLVRVIVGEMVAETEAIIASSQNFCREN